MKKVIITGATSMIGNAILMSCLAHGVEKAYAVVRPGSNRLDNIPSDDRVVMVECNAADYDMLPALIKESCDVFYHIAWSVTGSARNNNIYGQGENILYTLKAINSAKALGCRSFIGAGSQAEYGPLDLPKIGPDAPAAPIQPYGIAKYAAGALCMEQAKILDIICIWVRIFSVYGMYEKAGTMISSAIRKMLAGEETAFTKGIQLWDYLYSSDAGEAFFLLGEKADQSKIYCLGSGQARPLHEYIEIMRDEINPLHDTGIGTLPYGEGAIMNLCADISSLSADTHWRPRVSFEEGIRMRIGQIRDEIAKEN